MTTVPTYPHPPFLIIPKLFNISPAIIQYESFIEALVERIQSLMMLGSADISNFLNFGEGKKKIGKSLFHLYEQNALLYCKLIFEERTPSSSNLASYRN
jgi:hypothetical protein